MIPDTRVFHAERKRALDIAKDFEKRYGNEIIYNFELTDRQKIKWVNALIANVPLLIYPYAKEQSLDSIDDTYILFIRREGLYNRDNIN
uniref:GST N-terminal domain-containing protein n=1 Tax=Meloidogyne hapla TaxID=6305 RepID=A0A1I8B4E7_MELHA